MVTSSYFNECTIIPVWWCPQWNGVSWGQAQPCSLCQQCHPPAALEMKLFGVFLGKIEGSCTSNNMWGAHQNHLLPCTTPVLPCRSKCSHGMGQVPRKHLHCTGGRIQFPEGWGGTEGMASQSQRWLWSSEWCCSWGGGWKEKFERDFWAGHPMATITGGARFNVHSAGRVDPIVIKYPQRHLLLIDPIPIPVYPSKIKPLYEPSQPLKQRDFRACIYPRNKIFLGSFSVPAMSKQSSCGLQWYL